jgi:mutator protein MutT
MTKPSAPIGCIGIILNATKTKLFMTKRALSKKYYPGYWEFPGGTYEPSDPSFRHTIIRELKEELDINVQEPSFLYETKNDFDLPIHVFVISRWSGSLKLREDQIGGEWFGLDELKTIKTPSLALEALPRLMDFIAENVNK